MVVAEPHDLAMSSETTASRVDRLTRTIGEYVLCTEKNSDKVRHLPDNIKLYHAAAEEWALQTLNLQDPPQGDQQKRKEHYDFCNKICHGDPTAPQDCLLAVFAACAAIHVIIDQEALGLTDEQCGQISMGANDYALEQLAKSKEEPLPTGADYSTFPHHIVKAFYPVQPTDLREHLLGQSIRYWDSLGKIRECTVWDCGTSRLRGNWFIIAHEDDETEDMITSSEMDDILALRVPLNF